MVMRQRTWRKILLGVIIAWYGHSCQTPKGPSSQDFELDNEEDLTAEDGSATERRVSSTAVRIVHPKKPDAWHTRKSIMVSPQPSPERILECKESAESVSLNVLNLRALDEGALTLEGKVADARTVYHWCFYQLTSDLDIRLSSDSPLLTDKSQAFLSRMRVLWVLARALDSNSSRANTYTDYLRTRYVEMSQTHFGRTVEVIDPERLLTTAGKAGKSAGPYDGP